MASENRRVWTAAVAEAAATRARSQVIAHFRANGAADFGAVAGAVADGARRGTAGAFRWLPSVSRRDADRYAAAAASGASTGALSVDANYLLISETALVAPRVIGSRPRSTAASSRVRRAPAPSFAKGSCFRPFIAFSVGVAILAVFVVTLGLV